MYEFAFGNKLMRYDVSASEPSLFLMINPSYNLGKKHNVINLRYFVKTYSNVYIYILNK